MLTRVPFSVFESLAYRKSRVSDMSRTNSTR